MPVYKFGYTCIIIIIFKNVLYDVACVMGVVWAKFILPTA